MGGSTKETNTTSSQSQATRQATEQASQQATQQATTPWAATSGLLGNLLNQIGGLSPNLTEAESGALGQLSANASAGNPWASQIGGVANTLLAGGGPDRTPMVNGAYDQYRAALAPFARGDYVDPASDPALRSYLDVLKNDVSTQVNGMFAGAGRDLSGMNQQALARGITQAEAPVLLDAYNRALAGQRSAIDSLYGAGGQTAGLLSNLDQARLANQQAGIGAADAALTVAELGADATARGRSPAPRHSAANAGRAIRHGVAGGASLRHDGRNVIGVVVRNHVRDIGWIRHAAEDREHTLQSVVARPAGAHAAHGRNEPGRWCGVGAGRRSLQLAHRRLHGAEQFQRTIGRWTMSGIFPDIFGAGAGDGLLPFGAAPLAPNVIDGNRNAILGYLAGALQGGNLGQSIGRGLQGWTGGAQRDTAEQGQRAALQYVGEQQDMDPALKSALMQNPALAMQYLQIRARPHVTNDMAHYEYARKQGFGGTLADFIQSKHAG